MASSDSNALAIALSGFSVPAESELSAGVPQRRAATRKATKVVCAGIAPLVRHAREVASAVLEAACAAEYDPTDDADRIAQLCFALRSTVGALGRFSDEDEMALWELSQQLWECSMGRCGSEADSKAARVGDALCGMASELFALLEDDCDSTQDAANYVTFFCQAANTWAGMGKAQQAGECIRRAMKYSEQLEQLVDDANLPPAQRERHTVQLFELYLSAAKNAAAAKQQALASNLLSRAVLLSRHAAVGPSAAVCMCIAITELQLQQAREMLARGDSLLAVALLTAGYQQACSPDLPLSAVSERQHLEGLQESKKQMLLLLCQAHLASDNPGQAHKALETLERECGPQLAASAPDVQRMVLRVKLLAGRLTEALQLLSEGLRACDPAAPGALASLQGWLAGLQLALPYVCQAQLHAFQAVLTSFVWKAVGSAHMLLQLVQVLLAEAEGAAPKLCQQLALEVLSMEDVTASFYRCPDVQQQCHTALWVRATACFQTSDPGAARALFSAAFQLARPESRARNARVLAACHTQLGQHQRALEYLAIAERHEQQPTCSTQLARLQALVELGENEQAIAVIRVLEACGDFHPSLLPAVCQAAGRSRPQAPALYKEATGLALRVLIKPESSSTNVAAGQEAALLLEHMQAILLAVPAPAAAAAAAPAMSAVQLFNELVQATKLVAKQLKLLGSERFAGSTVQGSVQPGVLQAIIELAAGGVLRALQAGALEQVVTLATAACGLLALTDKAASVGQASRLQQAKVLLLAVQALLNLQERAGAGADGAHKLELAGKLLSKVSQHLGALPEDTAAPAWPLHHLLSLVVSARQSIAAGMQHSLACLQQCSQALSLQQRESLLDAVSLSDSQEVHAAAAALLLDGILADGSMEALALLPLLLQKLALCPQTRLDICRRLGQQHQLLAELLSPPEDSSQSSRNGHRWVQWIAAHAWNVGVQQVEAKQAEQGAALMEVALSLQAKLSSAAPGSSNGQLQSMEAALAALRQPAVQAEALMQERMEAEPLADIDTDVHSESQQESFGTSKSEGTPLEEGQPLAAADSAALHALDDAATGARLEEEERMCEQQGRRHDPGSALGQYMQEEEPAVEPQAADPPLGNTGTVSGQGQQGLHEAASPRHSPSVKPAAPPVSAAEVAAPAVVAAAAGIRTGTSAAGAVRAQAGGIPLAAAQHSVKLELAGSQDTSATDAALVCSEDALQDEGEGEEGAPTWLDAIFFAQQRALGGGSRAGGKPPGSTGQPAVHASRQAGQAAPAATAAAAASVLQHPTSCGTAAAVTPGAQAPELAAAAAAVFPDNADALELSMGDSLQA